MWPLLLCSSVLFGLGLGEPWRQSGGRRPRARRSPRRLRLVRSPRPLADRPRQRPGPPWCRALRPVASRHLYRRSPFRLLVPWHPQAPGRPEGLSWRPSRRHWECPRQGLPAWAPSWRLWGAVRRASLARRLLPLEPSPASQGWLAGRRQGVTAAVPVLPWPQRSGPPPPGLAQLCPWRVASSPWERRPLGLAPPFSDPRVLLQVLWLPAPVREAGLRHPLEPPMGLGFTGPPVKEQCVPRASSLAPSWRGPPRMPPAPSTARPFSAWIAATRRTSSASSSPASTSGPRHRRAQESWSRSSLVPRLAGLRSCTSARASAECALPRSLAAACSMSTSSGSVRWAA